MPTVRARCPECRMVTTAHDSDCTVGHREAREARVREVAAIVTAWDQSHVRWDDYPADLIAGWAAEYVAGEEVQG